MLLNCHQDLDTEMRLDLGALLQRDPSRIEAILDDSNRFEAAGSFGGFSTFLGSLMALKHEVCIYCIFYDVWISLTIQGGPSGRGTQFVDIKLKLMPQYKLLILNRNSYFNVSKRLSSTRRTTLYMYRVAQNHGKQVLRISPIKFHFLIIQFVVIPHGQRDLSSLPWTGEAAVQIS